MARTAVLGIGNVLVGDDALGPYAVKLLQAGWELPPALQVEEVGTPGPDLPLYLEGLDLAVVIDTVKARSRPGEIRVLDKSDLLANAPGFTATPHDPGLREALFTLDFHGTGPREVRLVGVIPASVEPRVGLSPEVRAALPGVLDEVVRTLRGAGLHARERAPRAEPDLWWERAGAHRGG